MAYASGFEHDVFISYAHLDDDPLTGSEVGWVTNLADNLRKMLAQKLGSKDCDVWMDHELSATEAITPQLLQNVQQTAILLVILSPGYLNSTWCEREKSAFLKLIRHEDKSRFFIVERDMIEDVERPKEFSDLKRFQFWEAIRPGEATRIFGFSRPDEDFFRKLNDLATDLKRKLIRLHQSPLAPPPPGISDAPRSVFEPPKQPCAFLALVTDDLERERDGVSRYLDQFGIRVVPKSCYPLEPNAFRKSLEQDLAQASLFVQLLSSTAGPKPLDLPQGYRRFQHEIAVSQKKKIMQWRSPALDISEIVDSEHRDFLHLETVRAENLEDFKREVRRLLLETPKPSADFPEDHLNTLVFVDPEAVDRPLGEQVCSILDKYGAEWVMPGDYQNPTEMRNQLEKYFGDCDAIIVIYGDTTREWVVGQLMECRKALARVSRAKPALAVFEGPPNEKQPLDMMLRDMRVLNCRAGCSETEIRNFLDGVVLEPGS